MRHVIFALLASASACASHPQPHDTSVVGHEQAARAHDQASETATTTTCGGARTVGPCWTVPSPGAAEAHRKAAAEHRAAAAALVAAETQACTGLSEDDRATSPLERRDDIASVDPLVETSESSKGGKTARQVGATVTLRAVPGLTSEYLQRLVECHLARNAALGHAVPEMPDCPLVPKGVTARVRSAGTGFAVDVRSDDPDTAREVLARAKRLVAASMSAR